MASAPPPPPFPPSLSLVAAWHQREVALGGAPRDRILRLPRELHARLLAEHEHLAQLRARGRAVRRERTLASCSTPALPTQLRYSVSSRNPGAPPAARESASAVAPASPM